MSRSTTPLPLRTSSGTETWSRHSPTRAPVAWIDVDDPDCSRAVTLYWGADSHLSTAAQLMRATITNWDWPIGATLA